MKTETLLLVGVGGFAIYWFLIRNPTPATPPAAATAPSTTGNAGGFAHGAFGNILRS